MSEPIDLKHPSILAAIGAALTAFLTYLGLKKSRDAQTKLLGVQASVEEEKAADLHDQRQENRVRRLEERLSRMEEREEASEKREAACEARSQAAEEKCEILSARVTRLEDVNRSLKGILRALLKRFADIGAPLAEDDAILHGIDLAEGA